MHYPFSENEFIFSKTVLAKIVFFSIFLVSFSPKKMKIQLICWVPIAILSNVHCFYRDDNAEAIEDLKKNLDQFMDICQKLMLNCQVKKSE